MGADDPVLAPSQRKLTGSKPGIFDPTQPARLLRLPNGSLAFASFDPRTATSCSHSPDVRKLSLNEQLYRPKRVVLETLPNGETFWRFVPKARWEEGVLDEGAWPRMVNICGQLVECSQDQWDIHKLDPMYDCCVRLELELTVISRVASYQAPYFRPFTPESVSGKRPTSKYPKSEPTQPRKPTVEDWESSDDELDDGNGMTIDETARRSRGPSSGPSSRIFRELKVAARQVRQQRTVHRANKMHEQQENFRADFNGQARLDEARAKRVPSPDRNVKRRADDPEFQETFLGENRSATMYKISMNPKRTRTLSPASAQKDLHSKKARRERVKRERRQREKEICRLARDMCLTAELFSGHAQVPSSDGIIPVSILPIFLSLTGSPENSRQDPTNTELSGDRHDEEQSFANAEMNEEAARLDAIEESRRKLAELEKDRPSWEEQARKRETQERAEQERVRAKSEALRRQEDQKIEAERRARAEQAQQEARLREEEQKRAQEEAVLREYERRERNLRWSTGHWTYDRAIERYRVLSELFDTAKFTEINPLTFKDVPWPVLISPMILTMQDITWGAVEMFFAAAKNHMLVQDYRRLVRTCHRRFHPDRWHARRLLNEKDFALLELAATTISQAVTPIWKSLPR
ncbi:hypothetical protein HGRIS_001042 [Hohenbuehelia grisea]|uniref:Uncharacterized protein n=1 Tax=Hohenbuehelia grisea TaxID=104357 RepID=A0ABR3JN31_9AGAR